MIETKSNLTTTEIDNIYQSMSASELWQLNADAESIEINYSKEEIEKSDKIYEIMDLTDLDYAEVELILDNPRNAPLCNIQIYCKAMKLDMFEFIGKALA